MIVIMTAMCGCGEKTESFDLDEKEAVNIEGETGIVEITEHTGEDDFVKPDLADSGEMKEIPDEGMEAEETEGVEDGADTQNGISASSVIKEEPFIFRDVFGVSYETSIDPGIKPCTYDKSLFRTIEGKMVYDSEGYVCRQGIDVSYHQGSIDWTKVKQAGYDFVILRIGFRGYGKEGKVREDPNFYDYLEGAHNAGLDVGVYFFSQAVNAEEALFEAEFVLKMLEGKSLELPVVYDPESILDDVARTDNVTPEQFTENTLVFCKRISEAGLEPMIYCNMLWEAFELDLEKLSEFRIWYADYEKIPQTPYHFVMWQYSNEGSVPGIQGNCDLDVWLEKQ